MNLIIRNTSGQPIYDQITAQIKAMILSGELAPGDALPSMRALAKDLNQKGSFSLCGVRLTALP